MLLKKSDEGDGNAGHGSAKRRFQDVVVDRGHEKDLPGAENGIGKLLKDVLLEDG
jgi:hypothetical protein